MGYGSRHSSASPTFFWHDYETTGTHKQLDRPTQFAGIRTDENLNIIGEPVMLYCQPAPDVIPHPMAVGITGITPQECQAKGLSEGDFAAAVTQHLGAPGTCGVGYNTLTFDDEVTRNLLFRNFQDPYAREWQNGNSRWDLLVATRLCYALRPEGIEWPTDDEGKVNLRLENLAKANNLKQERAHDALSDVEATIQLAKLLREKQRGLFDYALSLRQKTTSANLLVCPADFQMKPLVHVASFYPRERRFTSMIACLGDHPTQDKSRIVADLTGDLTPLLDYSAEDIAKRLFGGMAEEGEATKEKVRLPITMIQINKSPAVATIQAIRPDQRDAMGYTEEVMARCRANLELLRTHPHVIHNARKAFALLAQNFQAPADPELGIYAGFPNGADKASIARAGRASPSELATIRFTDPKYAELLLRFRARNYPSSLTADEQAQWRAHLHERLVTGGPATTLTLQGFREALEVTRARPDMAGKAALFDTLESWVDAQFGHLEVTAPATRSRPSP
jgi:exodeoxyribonuclease I